MDQIRVKSLLMVFLVLGLIVGQSTAALIDLCYLKCYVPCLVATHFQFSECKTACHAQCDGAPILPPPVQPSLPALYNLKDTEYYCYLGCASSLCNKLITKENSSEGQLKECVGSCSKTCIKA